MRKAGRGLEVRRVCHPSHRVRQSYMRLQFRRVLFRSPRVLQSYTRVLQSYTESYSPTPESYSPTPESYKQPLTLNPKL